ncbi:uncharacterized protein LOC135469660 isoform X3 [Liolophura sinensis]
MSMRMLLCLTWIYLLMSGSFCEERPVRHGRSKSHSKRAIAAAAQQFMMGQGQKIVGDGIQRIADKLFSEILDRNRKDEIFQSFGNHSEKFFDEATKESGQQHARLQGVMNKLRQRQDSFIKEGAEISIVPERGMDLGSMFLPPAWRIKESYPNKSPEPIDHNQFAYGYPGGIGNMLLNGCYTNGMMGYMNPHGPMGPMGPMYSQDPCRFAMRLLKGCRNLLDAASFIGVGFDGRGDYSASSRKNSVIQRTCNDRGKYGKYSVPDTMTVHGVYDTDTKTVAFESARQYQSYLESKAAVAQSSHMFQEATTKAYGRASFGFLGLFGGGFSVDSFDKESSSQTNSRFNAASRNQKTSQKGAMYLSVFELNVIRYELFLDDISFNDLNVEFLEDFLDLPVSYVGTNPQKFQDFILRWGTHFIKSAKFGGQLKLAKTKRAKEGETIDSFATKAEADYEGMFSTFSAKSFQYESSSLFHSAKAGVETKTGAG